MFFPSFLVEFLLVVPFIKFTSRFRSQPGWGQAVGIDVLPMQDGFDKGKDAGETPHGSLLVVESLKVGGLEIKPTTWDGAVKSPSEIYNGISTTNLPQVVSLCRNSSMDIFLPNIHGK